MARARARVTMTVTGTYRDRASGGWRPGGRSDFWHRERDQRSLAARVPGPASHRRSPGVALAPWASEPGTVRRRPAGNRDRDVTMTGP
jgi:hypothetical protein